jgi:hypothetical protein
MTKKTLQKTNGHSAPVGDPKPIGSTSLAPTPAEPEAPKPWRSSMAALLEGNAVAPVAKPAAPITLAQAAADVTAWMADRADQVNGACSAFLKHHHPAEAVLILVESQGPARLGELQPGKRRRARVPTFEIRALVKEMMSFAQETHANGWQQTLQAAVRNEQLVLLVAPLGGMPTLVTREILDKSLIKPRAGAAPEAAPEPKKIA